MEKNWYYSENGQDKRGPVTEHELQRLLADNQIPANTLVWSEGMANWAPANSVPGLQPTSSAAGPALGGIAPTAASQPHVATPGGSNVPAGLGGWMTFVGVMHIIGGVFACLTCIGLIYGIPMIMGGVSLLGAKNLLVTMPRVDGNMLPFLEKQRSAFKALGWAYILMIVFTLLIIILEIIFFAALIPNLAKLQH